MGRGEGLSPPKALCLSLEAKSAPVDISVTRLHYMVMSGSKEAGKSRTVFLLQQVEKAQEKVIFKEY